MLQTHYTVWSDARFTEGMFAFILGENTFKDYSVAIRGRDSSPIIAISYSEDAIDFISSISSIS